MWNPLNQVLDAVPTRKKSGMGTFTAIMVGAGVGIAAWETMKRSRAASQTWRGIKSSTENVIEDVQENQ